MTDDQVYDPDAIEFQIQSVEHFGTVDALEASDLQNNPHSIPFLLYLYRLSLQEGRMRANELVKARDEREDLVKQIHALKLKLGKAEERQGVLILEIPLSFLGGYAINLLSANSSDGMGWLLFLLSFLMIVMVRWPQIGPLLKGLQDRGKDAKD